MSIMYDYNRSGEVEKLIYTSFPELQNEINFIKINFSDELPPILANYSNQNFEELRNTWFIQSFDGRLGEYNPETKEITIYLQGFNFSTNIILSQTGINDIFVFYKTLLKIVILHEIGHFWFDNMVQLQNAKIQNKGHFNNDLSKYPYKDYKRVYEWVAQMFAYLCLDNEQDKDFMTRYSNNIKDPNYHLKDEDINFSGNHLVIFKKTIGILYLNLFIKNNKTPFDIDLSLNNVEGCFKGIDVFDNKVDLEKLKDKIDISIDSATYKI